MLGVLRCQSRQATPALRRVSTLRRHSSLRLQVSVALLRQDHDSGRAQTPLTARVRTLRPPLRMRGGYAQHQLQHHPKPCRLTLALGAGKHVWKVSMPHCHTSLPSQVSAVLLAQDRDKRHAHMLLIPCLNALSIPPGMGGGTPKQHPLHPRAWAVWSCQELEIRLAVHILEAIHPICLTTLAVALLRSASRMFSLLRIT